MPFVWQVMKTFHIRDLFWKALMACPDITEAAFPYLFENKKNENRSGNVSKITRQEFHKLMIFVARIYQAHVTINKIGNSVTLPSFVFQSYDGLELAFRAIENHLQETTMVKPQKKMMPSMLVMAIGNDLVFCKKTFEGYGRAHPAGRRKTK